MKASKGMRFEETVFTRSHRDKHPGPLDQGAETIIWAVTAPELAGISGQYFADQRPISSQAITHDPRALRGLWEVSERMTGHRPGGNE